MPLVYTTGTINQPDAGSVGLSMAEKIRDDVVASAAWDLVEEFTPATGTCRWYVFKCLASISGLPNDFFVVMGRTLSTGELKFAICENYVTGSHTMSGYLRAGGGTITYDANGRQQDSYSLSTVPFPGSSTSPFNHNWIPAGTSTKWWIIVDDDGFTAAFNGASNGFVHIGAYIPLLSTLALTLPLQMIGYSNSSGCITRNPACADATVTASGLLIAGGGGSSAGNGQPLGFQGDLRYNDKLQGNQRPVAEQGINIQISTGDQAAIGWALGKQKRMRVTNSSTPPGFAFGDAYALAGKLWVPYAPNDPRMWDTGVLAA